MILSVFQKWWPGPLSVKGVIGAKLVYQVVARLVKLKEGNEAVSRGVAQ